jgi:hypothetical protein
MRPMSFVGVVCTDHVLGGCSVMANNIDTRDNPDIGRLASTDELLARRYFDRYK